VIGSQSTRRAFLRHCAPPPGLAKLTRIRAKNLSGQRRILRDKTSGYSSEGWMDSIQTCPDSRWEPREPHEQAVKELNPLG
jgi:hypothetical protein